MSFYSPDTYVCTLSDELQKFAKKELREDEKTREQALAQMRDWIAKTDYIKDCRVGEEINKFLNFFLNYSFIVFDLEECQTLLQFFVLFSRCKFPAPIPPREEV